MAENEKNLFKLQKVNHKAEYKHNFRVLNSNNNTLGVTIPKDIVNLIGLSPEDSMKFTVIPHDDNNIKVEMEIIKK